jgi:Uma2 family endonuclease
LPAVDERLVVADSGYEIVDGKVYAVSPAFEPHARRHAKITALLEAHVADDYTVAVDMLTRAGPQEDFAPDISIFRSARDPETGGRQLEEFVFEIVSTETLAHAGAKAASLVRRGVRRVIAIDVERERALQWSAATAGWEILGPDARIDDPLFVTPLVVRELVDVAKADDGLARALMAKRNPLLEDAFASLRARSLDEGRAQGRLEGRLEAEMEGRLTGTAATIVAILFARGLAPTAAEQSRILAIRDADELARCVALAVTCATVSDLFAD